MAKLHFLRFDLRKHPMANDPQQVMVLAWYSREQWKLLKRRAADAHLLDDSYDDWLEQMNRLVRQMKQKGNALIKCFVDVEELELWCKKVNVPNDAKARSRYVAEMAHEKKTGQE